MNALVGYAADTPFPSSQDDEDVYILSKIADILHSFFGTHNEAFLPVFEKVMPFFVKMLVSCLFGAGSVEPLSVLTDSRPNHALLCGTGFLCPLCARYCHPCFVEICDWRTTLQIGHLLVRMVLMKSYPSCFCWINPWTSKDHRSFTNTFVWCLELSLKRVPLHFLRKMLLWALQVTRLFSTEKN